MINPLTVIRKKRQAKSEYEFILDTVGDILYKFGLYSDKFSFLAGRYQLPIKPLDNALVVGPWLKIEIDTELLPRGVFLQDLEDPRLLSTLKAALGRNVETRCSAVAPGQSAWGESAVPNADVRSAEFWFFVELSSQNLRGIGRCIDFCHLPSADQLKFSTLPIPLGYSLSGFEYVDLSHLVSFLVCGATRQGKSVFLRQMLTYLANNFTPAQFQAYLGDFKFGVEFGNFHGDHFTIYPDPDSILDAVQIEMTRRFADCIKPSGCRSVLDFNAKFPDQALPYVLVVVDEFAAFKLQGGKSAISQAELLAAQSAGAGLYWVVSTQRPSTDIVTGSLKANLGGRISFSLATKIDSEVVFGVELPEVVQIGCPGRGFALVSDRLFEFQSVFLE